MPDWLTVVIACATPVLAYLGVLTANRHSRTGAVEAEARERRKQNLELLCKAVEWSTSANDKLAAAGVAMLDALDAAGLLEEDDQAILDGAYAAVLVEPYMALQTAPGTPVVQAPSAEHPDRK